MTTLLIADIKVHAGRRQINKEKLAGLIESIRGIGLINPITVNKKKELVAGYHRLEAYRAMGLAEIEANVIDFTKDNADIAEIDENLARCELNAMELAECLKRRKEVYEKIHPQTKQGGDPTSKAKTQSENPAVSFAKDTELQTGISERSVRENVKLAKDLSKPAKEKLADTPIADNKEELKALASVPKQQQAKIVEKVISGEVSSVRAAVEQQKPAPVPVTDIEYEPHEVAPITSPNPIIQRKSAQEFYADEFFKVWGKSLSSALIDIRSAQPNLTYGQILYNGVLALAEAKKKR